MPTKPKAQKRPTAAQQKAKAVTRWEGEGGAAVPKRPKHPADVIPNAVRVTQVATSEAEDEAEEEYKGGSKP